MYAPPISTPAPSLNYSARKTVVAKVRIATTTSHCLFVTSLVLCVLIASLGIAGISTDTWMDVTITVFNNKTQSNSGLFRSCVSGNCKDVTSYSDYVCPSGTIRRGSELKDRIDTVKATMFIGIFMAIGMIVLDVFGYMDAKRLIWWVGIFMSLLGMVCFIIAVVLYSHSVDYWYKCDAGFCADISSCTFTYGYSFALAVAAMGLSIVNSCIIALLYSQTVPDKQRLRLLNVRRNSMPPLSPSYRGTPMVTSSSYRRGPTPPPTSPRGLGTPRSLVGGAPPPPPSPRSSGLADVIDWEYDSGSGMYWSASKQLYLDQTTKRYYDPISRQWYDPNTGAWFAA